MFLSLNHKKLDVYIVCRTFVTDCYKNTASFPPDEKYALVTQIRRAATSILLNIAEGSSRKSKAERTRYYEIARGSLVEIDAAFDISDQLAYLHGVDVQPFSILMNRCMSLITALINSNRS